MSRPATPLAAAVPVHGDGPAPGHGGHDHGHGHDGGGHDHAHGHAHDHAHDHAHGHAHAHADGHAAGHPHRADPAAAPDGSLPASLLMAGAGSRLLATLGLLALLWAAVAWALGESA